MVDKQEQAGLKSFLLWSGGVLAAIGTAFQIAGVTSTLLADVILIFGVWIFSGAEVWFAQWIKTTGRYKNSVVAGVTSVAGCCALAVSGWISNAKSQQQSSASTVSFVQLDKVFFVKGFATLKAGDVLKVDVYYGQHGPEPLRNVLGISSALYIKDPKANADSMASAMFQQQTLDKAKAEYASGKLKGADLSVGQAQWTTLSVPIADQSGVDAILDGRIRLYIFGWSTWTDLEGRTSERVYCRWLQHPSSVILYPPEDLVWRICYQ